jgi:ParB-like chromosome segregation protein Spo0J
MNDPATDLLADPLVVEKDEEENFYSVLDGNHRLHALKEKGYSGKVPCIVRKVDNDVDRIRIALRKHLFWIMGAGWWHRTRQQS